MNYIVELTNQITQLVNHYTFDGYHQVVKAFSPALTTLMVIYFAGLGWLVIRGLIPLTPLAVAWHMVKAAFIFSFALHWDYFSFLFVNIFVHGPDQIITMILPPDSQNTDKAGLILSLSKFWELGNNVFAGVWRSAGPDFLLGTIMGLLGFIGVTLFTAIGLFYLMMSKIALSALLILAPLILPMYLWQASRGIFNSWLQLLVQWSMTPLFLSAFMAVLLKPLQNLITAMAALPNGPTTASISTFLLLSLVASAVCKQAGTISRALAAKIEIGDGGGFGESVPAMTYKALRQRGSL